MTLWGRARIALIGLALVTVLFVFVFPTRSYLAQRHQVSGAERDVSVLQQQNARLQQEARQLQSASEVERMAREQFHMVFPGEQAYTVMPSPAATTTTTTTTTTVP
jgi:cell division protein FtsL